MPRWGTVDELLAVDEIEIVVNLTIPAVHAEIGLRAVAAGKHVWSEKPLALDRGQADELLAAARAAGVLIGCAPDTVLGAGIQTALRAIRRGDIGEPLTATTVFQLPGPDVWHPSPEFLFARGAGPLFDVGPYYLTTLVHVFGPARRVSAESSTSRVTRTIGSGPRAGATFPVEVPTHHAALIGFDAGQSAQSVFSFQNARTRMGIVEISGTEGTLVLPDPNLFDGSSQLWTAGRAEPVTLDAVGSTFGRGTGVADLARAVRTGSAVRASGAVASHVLDVLLAVSTAAEIGETVEVTSTVDRPELTDEGWDPSAATL